MKFTVKLKPRHTVVNCFIITLFTNKKKISPRIAALKIKLKRIKFYLTNIPLSLNTPVLFSIFWFPNGKNYCYTMVNYPLFRLIYFFIRNQF